MPKYHAQSYVQTIQRQRNASNFYRQQQNYGTSDAIKFSLTSFLSILIYKIPHETQKDMKRIYSWQQQSCTLEICFASVPLSSPSREHKFNRFDVKNVFIQFKLEIFTFSSASRFFTFAVGILRCH